MVCKGGGTGQSKSSKSFVYEKVIKSRDGPWGLVPKSSNFKPHTDLQCSRQIWIRITDRATGGFGTFLLSSIKVTLTVSCFAEFEIVEASNIKYMGDWLARLDRLAKSAHSTSYATRIGLETTCCG